MAPAPGTRVPIWLWVKTVLGSYFGWKVNSPPSLEPFLVGVESDVHWGTGFGFGKAHGHIGRWEPRSRPQKMLTCTHASEQTCLPHVPGVPVRESPTAIKSRERL